MTNATLRNEKFETLVNITKSLEFGKQLTILQSFAESHGVKLMHDATGFELWSVNFSRKPLFRAV